MYRHGSVGIEAHGASAALQVDLSIKLIVMSEIDLMF